MPPTGAPGPAAPPAAEIDPACPSTGRHNTREAYLRDRCRCPVARRISTRYRKHWNVDKLAGKARMVDATGTRRRIQALTAAGWDHTTIAVRLGLAGRSSVQGMLRYQRVRLTTAQRVGRLYDQLAGQPGPSVRAAFQARQYGYAPPLAWDEDTIDDPAAGPADGWQRDPDAPLVADMDDIEHLRRYGMDDETIEREHRIAPADVLAAATRRRIAEENARTRYRDDPQRVAAAVQAAQDGAGEPLRGLTSRETALAVLALHEGGWTYAEITRRTGRAPSTARTDAHRGRIFRAELAARQDEAAA